MIVALILFSGELGLPIFVPGEVALLVASSQLIRSVPQLGLAILLFGALDFASTLTLHAMARTGGNRLLRYLLRRYRHDGRSPEQVLAAWRTRLGGHDALVIFVMRFVPVARMYASLLSGLVRIRLRYFVTGAAPAAFLWAAVPLVLGYAVRRHAGDVEAHYTGALQVAGAILGVFVAAIVVWWIVHRRATIS